MAVIMLAGTGKISNALAQTLTLTAGATDSISLVVLGRKHTHAEQTLGQAQAIASCFDRKVQSLPYFAETDFMHLYIVRHGETWANAEHRYLGSLDPELTALGRQQAQTLCEQLPASLDVLVVSPRLRAVQTASILNERLKLSPETMDCFRERDVGVFEGLTQGDAKKRYPQLWTQNITRLWDAGPTDGESISAVVERVRDGLAELESKYPSKTVLLVAHGFVAKVVRALAIGDFSDFYEWQLSNGNMLFLQSFNIPTQDLETLRRSLPIA